jgi:hypothetical protein
LIGQKARLLSGSGADLKYARSRRQVGSDQGEFRRANLVQE